jgi:hypothetical protein
MDLRLPIGLLFLIFGLLLTALGASTPPTLYAKSLGINVNLLWGCCYDGVRGDILRSEPLCPSLH